VSAQETATRLGRLRGLDALSDTRGIFALAAIDHRDALGVAFKNAGFETP
jgi:tagatose-1,6-bisphosphate aldolase